MIVEPDFLDHWRTQMLADLLSDPMAPVYVLRLWAHCQNRRSSRFEIPAPALKAICRAPGNPEAFEAAMIQAGFVERDGSSITARKWEDYNAGLVQKWDAGKLGGRPRKVNAEKPERNRTETGWKPESAPGSAPVNRVETGQEPEPAPGYAPPNRLEKRREEERREEKTEDKGAPLKHPKDGSFQGNQTENRAHFEVCPETAPGSPLPRFELTPEGLSQLWTIERRGAPGAKEEPRYLADEIREAIRLGADPEQLQAAIRSRDRDHGEQWWQFKRREIEDKRAGKGKARETPMERGRRLAAKVGALRGESA